MRNCLLLLALLGACTRPDDTGVHTGDTEVVDDGISAPNAKPSEVVPTVVFVSWTTDVPGTSWVEYGLDGQLGQQTPPTLEASTHHEVTVLGLKAGHTYTFRAVTLTSAGETLHSARDTLTVAVPPGKLYPVYAVMADEARAQPGGYLLTSLIGVGKAFVAIFDRDGDYVWFYADPEGLTTFTTKLSRDERGLAFNLHHPSRTVDLGAVEWMSIDGRSSTRTRTKSGHHDFVEHDDGQVAWISYEFQEWDGITTRADAILTAEEGEDDSEATHRVFSFFDDYEVDLEAICPPGMAGPQADQRECTHSNSLIYDPDDDAYLLMSWYLDALFKIDRSTGQILWQMGGEHNEFEATGDGVWWTRAHVSQIWDGGMVVFDNGFDHEPARSRVVEYAFDEEARTLHKVWEFWEPDGRVIQFLGDAQKLPNGNYLITWSTAGRVTEITPDGRAVWYSDCELGQMLSRTTWVEDLYQLL